MRVKHTAHSFQSFPIYASTFVSAEQVVLGGGGGTSKSGVKNKLKLFCVGNDLSVDLQDEFELTKGEDAPMSMAAHPKDRRLACGVNSTPEQLEKGKNENCRIFQVEDKKLSLVQTKGTFTLKDDDDDFQKVTVFSSSGTLLAVASSHKLTLLSYPSLVPVATPLTTEKEIYDATFSADKLVVATVANLQVYTIPEVLQSSNDSNPNSKEKKGKQKAQSESSLPTLKLERTVDLPSLGGVTGGSFRTVSQHPTLPEVLYTTINTTPTRTKSRSSPKQGYVCKWNTSSWTMEKSKKVGDRGLTCFSLSPDGKFIGYGSSDLSVGILDANLSSVSTILKAHDFPPTTIAFNPTSTLLASSSADNSLRIIRVPEEFSSTGWGFLAIIFAILVLFIAFAIQKSLLS